MKDITRHQQIRPKVRIFAPNHTIVITSYGEYFMSYDSTIAFTPYDEDILYLGPDYNYSVTTSKHLNKYLDTSGKELTQGIKNGAVKLVKL